MKIKKSILISLGLMSLVSCGTLDKELLKPKEANSLIYNGPTDFIGARVSSDYDDMSKIKAKDFTYNGNYFYKGEKINITGDNAYINDQVKILCMYTANPTKIVDKDDTKYKNVEGKYKVEEKDGKKIVTFLDQLAVFVRLEDNDGKTRDLQLNQVAKIKELPEPEDGVRYKDLKKGSDNGRVRHTVLTYNGGFTDEFKKDKDGKIVPFNYSMYFGADKYHDEDDVIGRKKVKVKTYTNGDESSIKEVYVDFGTKLSDFRDNYGELLSNLDKQTLKFSEDGKSVTGGFNPELVEKITKYEKEKDPNTKLQFVTEILDNNKSVVGKHDVVRKIVKDGVVIFEKKEKAYVAFPGTTVGVVDGTFFDASPEVEARMVRYLPKETDSSPAPDPKDKGLRREHGVTVIGSMIDELSLGNSYTLRAVLYSHDTVKKQLLTPILFKETPTHKLSVIDYDDQLNPLKEKFLELKKILVMLVGKDNKVAAPKIAKLEGKIREAAVRSIELYTQYRLANLEDEDLKEGIYEQQFESYAKEKKFDKKSSHEFYKDYPKEYAAFKKKMVAEYSKFEETLKEDEKPIKVPEENPWGPSFTPEQKKDQEEKQKESTKRRLIRIEKMRVKNNKELLEKYNEMYPLYEEMINIPETEKLGYTDLHFATVAIGDKDTGSLTRNSGKYIARMLEENKNIKAINMSYGSDKTIDDYLDIKNMSLEDKKKAVEAYNTNPDFRTAVKIWLHKLDKMYLKNYIEDEAGELGIPNMVDYFNSRDKIDLDDYQKLLDLRMLSIKNAFNSISQELTNANNDVLFVVAASNSRNNSDSTDVDLVHFNENGKKTLYQDPNKKYSNTFADRPLYLEEMEKEKAKEEGREYKYDPGYRKNIISVVGLGPAELTSTFSEDDISPLYRLNASNGVFMMRLKMFAAGMLDYYQTLKELKKNVEKNPSKYPRGFVDEINAEIRSIDNVVALGDPKNYEKDPLGRPISNVVKDPDGRRNVFSFSRAGRAKLWSVAAIGNYAYTKKFTEEDKKYNKDFDFNGRRDDDYITNNHYYGSNPIIAGSSFAAPRVTAIAGEVGTKFPWMTAHQIKQTIFTSATDDFRKNSDGEWVGKYGVDDVIGWGIVNKEMALLGPGRFVKALTMETGDKDFVADIPYGTYEFQNLKIDGGFNKYIYAGTREKESNLKLNEARILNLVSGLDKDYVLSDKFDKAPENKNLMDTLMKLGYKKEQIYNEFLPKFEKYWNTLDEKEKDLFVDSGLEKKGNGTLIIRGAGEFKAPTTVKEGTLVLSGGYASPITVSENAKLKLDMRTLEYIYFSIYNGNVPYTSSITADITNKGELYSYSESDRINAKYVPYSTSKTKIATFAKLSIDELDLSKTDLFDFDIFRKKGVAIFNNLIQLKPGETFKEGEEQKSEKSILEVKKLDKKQLYKVKLGTTSITPYVDLVIEKHDIDKDKDHVMLEAKLVRKVVNPESMKTVNKIMAKLKKDKDLVKLNDTSWFTIEDEEKIDNKAMVNSELLGYELVDLKNSKINERLVTKGKANKFDVYFNVINQTKFKLSKESGDKRIFTNGFNLGFDYTTKHNTIGLGFNYTNNILQDYKIPLKVEYGVKQEYIQGKASANNFGLSFYDKFDYNNGYVSGILGIDYLDKKVIKVIIDKGTKEEKETKEINSSDLVANINLEGGYKFNLPKNVSIEPFVGTNFITYLRGGFDENTELGYESDPEVNFKANMTLGARVRAQLSETFNLGGFMSYTKYLTNPTLKLKADLKEYNFQNEIEGLKLEDNYVKYGVDLRAKAKDNIEINISYQGKNLKTHGVSAGVKFEF